QIADGERYTVSETRRRMRVGVDDFAPSTSLLTSTPTLTCMGAQIIQEEKAAVESYLTGRKTNRLTNATRATSRDTFADAFDADEKSKVSPGFRHRSVARDTVMEALGKHSSWVKIKTIAEETGRSVGSVKKQLQRLNVAGFVDSDGKGRYRKH